MDDKNIMATILGNLKGGCDLMMHGSIESNTANVRSAFNCALNDFLKMQSDTYSKMSAKGWYPHPDGGTDKNRSGQAKIRQRVKRGGLPAERQSLPKRKTASGGFLAAFQNASRPAAGETTWGRPRKKRRTARALHRLPPHPAGSGPPNEAAHGSAPSA